MCWGFYLSYTKWWWWVCNRVYTPRACTSWQQPWVFITLPKFLPNKHKRNNDINPDANCKSNLKIIYQNFQCISSTRINVINDVCFSHNYPDFLCFTEHWQEKSSLDIIKINQYNLASSFCRKNTRHGGSVIYVKDDKNLDFKVRDDIEKLSIENTIEISAIELINPHVLVCCIYRLPTADDIIFFG